MNRYHDSAIDAGMDARILAWRSAGSYPAVPDQASILSVDREEPNLLSMTCRMMDARSVSLSVDGGGRVFIENGELGIPSIRSLE